MDEEDGETVCGFPIDRTRRMRLSSVESAAEVTLFSSCFHREIDGGVGAELNEDSAA